MRQMGITGFQVDNILKNVYNQKYLKTESDWNLVNLCTEKQIQNIEIINCVYVYDVWHHIRLIVYLFKNEVHISMIDPVQTYRSPGSP